MTEASSTAEDAAVVRPFLRDVPADGEPADTDVSTSAVRPFLLTRGRTAGDAPIALEAQVLATDGGRACLDRLALEYRAIVELCDEPLAVAEVAAALDLHLGVARVLIGDLAHRGLVSTAVAELEVMDEVETIMRVIDGLQRRG